MRKTVLFLLILLLTAACKKDTVDATNLKTFQSSVNDMASSLNTIHQIKFNEALYILKTFGVAAEGDTYELNALAKLVAGKKVPEILAMADQVAQKNGIAWSSNGPPSLGSMNIFGEMDPKETDANDIAASGLSIQTNPVSVDSVLGPKGLQVIPKLVDSKGKPISFSGAALEATLQVMSNGVQIFSSKNLMQDNNFHGFTVRYPNLSASKIVDNKIDVTVSVKTSKKTFKMSKIGIFVNPKALRQPPVAPKPVTIEEPQPITDPAVSPVTEPAVGDPVAPSAAGDPKATVQRFLNNLSSQNLRAAYEQAENPSWGSYENFSNATSGFGSVKNLNVKGINTTASGPSNASVSATYDVTDKNGNTTPVKASFGLKNVDGQWKITSYRFN